MFVYSVKSKQIKFILLVSFVVMTMVSLFILSNENKQTGSIKSVSYAGETHEQRMEFISQFDWEVVEEPVEVKEVIIPDKPDDTYTAYNEIQKSQGFDLDSFAGKRAKCWTYTVKNYEGYENQECIHANILVYDGKVIGGDICSVRLDGFMHGFIGNQNGKT